MFQSRVTRFVLCVCAITLAHADDSKLGALPQLPQSSSQDSKVEDLQNDASKAMKGMQEAADGAKDVRQGNFQQGIQDMSNGAQETQKAAKNGMQTVDGQQSVSGHMQMNVAKHVRRLQSAHITTGFGQDSGAQNAVKQAIAKKAQTTADTVHITQSEAAASSTRRLAAGDPTGVVTVYYTVDCADSLTCLQMYTLLRAVEEEDWTAEILADLQEGSPFTVEVTRHLVDMVPCAVFGQGYNDPQANKTPNGAYMATAAICQNLCHLSASCKYFTWYKDTSACWLQGNNSALEVVSDNAIAGPSVCPATEKGEAVVQEWVIGDANLGTNLPTSHYGALTMGLLPGSIMMVSVGFVCAGRRSKNASMTAYPVNLDEEMIADPAQE